MVGEDARYHQVDEVLMAAQGAGLDDVSAHDMDPRPGHVFEDAAVFRSCQRVGARAVKSAQS